MYQLPKSCKYQPQSNMLKNLTSFLTSLSKLLAMFMKESEQTLSPLMEEQTRVILTGVLQGDTLAPYRLAS